MSHGITKHHFNRRAAFGKKVFGVGKRSRKAYPLSLNPLFEKIFKISKAMPTFNIEKRLAGVDPFFSNRDIPKHWHPKLKAFCHQLILRFQILSPQERFKKPQLIIFSGAQKKLKIKSKEFLHTKSSKTTPSLIYPCVNGFLIKGMPFLSFAIHFGDWESVTGLLEMGANPNQCDVRNHLTPMDMALRYPKFKRHPIPAHLVNRSNLIVLPDEVREKLIRCGAKPLWRQPGYFRKIEWERIYCMIEEQSILDALPNADFKTKLKRL